MGKINVVARESHSLTKNVVADLNKTFKVNNTENLLRGRKKLKNIIREQRDDSIYGEKIH